mmetsp:Transcript_65322/g.155981  ORF Transcript_65322/g.155981 Transcript_65322/m.155981 type:complete len:324 (-) Transcript_65322:422-1393(-)
MLQEFVEASMCFQQPEQPQQPEKADCLSDAKEADPFARRDALGVGPLKQVQRPVNSNNGQVQNQPAAAIVPGNLPQAHLDDSFVLDGIAHEEGHWHVTGPVDRGEQAHDDVEVGVRRLKDCHGQPNEVVDDEQQPENLVGDAFWGAGVGHQARNTRDERSTSVHGHTALHHAIRVSVLVFVGGHVSRRNSSRLLANRVFGPNRQQLDVLQPQAYADSGASSAVQCHGSALPPSRHVLRGNHGAVPAGSWWPRKHWPTRARLASTAAGYEIAKGDPQVTTRRTAGGHEAIAGISTSRCWQADRLLRGGVPRGGMRRGCPGFAAG